MCPPSLRRVYDVGRKPSRRYVSMDIGSLHMSETVVSVGLGLSRLGTVPEGDFFTPRVGWFRGEPGFLCTHVVVGNSVMVVSGPYLCLLPIREGRCDDT